MMFRPVALRRALIALALASLAPAAAQAAPPAADPAVPLKRFIDEAWNRGDYSGMTEIIGPGAILHYGGKAYPQTPEQATAVVKAWRTGFPDFHFQLEDMVVQGDRAVARLVFTGTHTGKFWGPPTGRPITVTETLSCQVVDGRLSECWEDYDEYGMRRQLGLLPPAP